MPKINGGWRQILDLRLLNKFLGPKKFRVVSLAAIIPSLDSEDWFWTSTFKDAYFHVVIHLFHRRYQHSVIGQDHFEYGVLLFSLCLS